MSYTLKSLLAGRSLRAPRESDDDADSNESQASVPMGRTIDAQAIAAAAESDTKLAVDAAIKEATAAANARWNTVMTSDAGAANPKGAAKLLMAAGGGMTAEEVVDTLGDVAAPDPKAAQSQAQAETAEADRKKLAEDTDSRPDTGRASGGGEGDDAEKQARIDRRKARVEQNNQRVARTGGGGRRVRGGRNQD